MTSSGCSVGPSPYFELARAIAQAFEKLATNDARAARRELEREAMIALSVANRALRRFAWLDALALAAIVLAGVSAATDRRVNLVLALEVFAATLLWLANVRAMRSIATRMYAGATALVGDLVRGFDALRSASAGASKAAPATE